MSKKSIIALITVIVLLFAAGISVGVFLYTKGTTQATEGTQTTDQIQTPDGENEAVDENSAKQDDNTTTVDNENANTDNDATNNNVANNTNIAGNVNNANNGNSENIGVTTETGVNNIGETTIERVEEQEKLVSKDFWNWWQPMTVAIQPTEVGVELPQISIKKTATVNDVIDSLVYADQDITYIIAVTNNGKTAVENIEISDKIPESTTYVDGSIKDAFMVVPEDGKLGQKTVEGAKNSIIMSNSLVKGLKWNVTIPAEKTVYVSFTVKVNTGATGTILNSAIANGEESNKTETSIIKTNKSSVVKRLETDSSEYKEVQTAKIGDLVTYTITVENTGTVEGTVYIEDIVPNGTKFVTAQEGAEITSNNQGTTVAWSVNVPAGKTITREFVCEVINVDGKIRNIAKVDGTPTNEDVIETAEIDILKEVLNKKEKYLLGEKVEYKVTVTNKGTKSIEGIRLEDKVNETTNITTVTEVNEEEKTIGTRNLETYTFTLEPEEKAYFKYTYTVVEADITKGIITNVAIVEAPEVDPKKDTKTVTPSDPYKELSVDKIVENKKEEYILGDKVEYKVVVTNTGNQTIEGISLEDKVNGTTNITTAIEVNSEGKTIETRELETYTFTLEPGEKAYFKYTYTVVEADITKGTITNIAIAKAPDVEPKEDTETVKVERKVNVTKYKNNIASTNIVLVLDVSSSMNNQKIVDARNAINTFVENTYSKPKNKNVTFTLITFASRDYTEGNGTKKDTPADLIGQKGGVFKFNDKGDYIVTYSKKDEFKNAVENIVTDRRTNIRAGLEVTEKVLYGEDGKSGIAGMSEYKDYEQIVIFFSDGKPYEETEKLNNEKGIKAKADDIRKKGAKIFSIGFGSEVSEPESQGYKVLVKISNDGKVYTSSDYTGLVRDFIKIIGSDPSYDQITINGDAIINITSVDQEIIVDEKNPIIITIDETTIEIKDEATAKKNNINYTTKGITWNVKNYSATAKLSISYHVQ